MITIVGLGEKRGDVTRRGESAIREASKVFLRTALTETAHSLDDLGVKYISFDELYEGADSFDALNNAICERLIEESRDSSVCYCVDGSGLGDGSVEALLQRTDAVLVPGVGSESTLVVGRGATSYTVYSAYDFVEHPAVNRHLTTVIKDVDGAFLAGEIKLLLIDLVGEDEDVLFFKGDDVRGVKVSELDRQEYSYDTGVIIPTASLTEKKRWGFDDLIEILVKLRSENGCPWDREQTHQSIRKNLIEEAYELAEGIDRDDIDMMEEETGDVLLQAAFHAEIGSESGEFSVTDVLTRLCDKLISRHEHVFGDVVARSGEEALSVWENAKKKEKRTANASEAVHKIAVTLPALMRAAKVIKIALKDGVQGVQFDDADLRRMVDEGRYADLLFAVVCRMRIGGEDAEEALAKRLSELERRIDEKYGV